MISPAGTLEDLSLIDQAKQRLENWGYVVSLGKHAKSTYGGYAGTDQERVQDIQEAIDDQEVDIILCNRGGYGMTRIIDRVSIPAHFNKIVIGFSDITVFHAALGAKNIPSLHSIMVKHIATLPDESETLVAFKNTLIGKEIKYTIPAHAMNRLGEVTSTLVGGNLSVFYGLRGTRFDQHFEDAILFIEDIGEPAHAIDRMMQNLRHAGHLEKLKGLIVGQFTNCREDDRLMKTIKEGILDACKDYSFPICFDFPAGHVDYNLPIILHAPCHLRVLSDEVIFEQENILLRNK